MTPEIPANVQFLITPELSEFIVWSVTAVVTGLCTGIIFLYKDNRKERREYMEKLLDAFNQSKNSTDRLCDTVARSERTMQNLERLILEKLDR